MPDVASPPPEVLALELTDRRPGEFDLKVEVYAPLHKRSVTEEARDAWAHLTDLYKLLLMAQGAAPFQFPWKAVELLEFRPKSCVYKDTTYAGGFFTFELKRVPRRGRYHILRLERDSGYAQRVFDVPED